MTIANSEKVLFSFIDNTNRSYGNPMSTYFVLLKGQMADFFRALDSVIIFERSSSVINDIQNKIFSSVFSNNPMSFLGMLFADTVTVNNPIEFSELPRTMRLSFESQITHGKKNAFISIKEVFLLKTLWLVRKHHNNFWWKNFMFAITDSIFDYLITNWPSQAAKFLILVEYFFIFELEVVAMPFAKSTHGVSNEFEVLQISEPVIVLYHIYLEKYCAYLKSEMAKSITKRDQHIYSIFKMYAQKTESFFSYLFRIVHSKQCFFFKSIKLIVHQYLEPLNSWNTSDEFMRLYIEVNYPTIKKVQEEFIKFMMNTDYDDAQDLAGIEQTIKFFLKIRKYEEEKGPKQVNPSPIIDSNTILHIYKKVVTVAQGPDILRSLRDVSNWLGLSNIGELEREIELEITTRNQKLRERQTRPSSTLKRSLKELNWNSHFDHYTESELFYWIFYYIALLIDKIFRRKKNGITDSTSGSYLIRNGEMIPYKNPMLIGRTVPVTNLRSFASKSLRNFVFGGIIAFVLMVLFVN